MIYRKELNRGQVVITTRPFRKIKVKKLNDTRKGRVAFSKELTVIYWI